MPATLICWRKKPNKQTKTTNQPNKIVTSPTLRGKSLWNSLPYSSPDVSALWDKSFSYQSTGSFISGKTQGHRIYPHPAHCITWTCSALPKGAHGMDCFAVSMHGATGAGEERKHGWHICLTDSITGTQAGGWLHYLSVLLQEYGCLCMLSLFNQFSYQKKWSFSFPETAGFCATKIQSRRKSHSLRHFLSAHTCTQLLNYSCDLKGAPYKSIKGMKDLNHIKWQKKQILEYPTLED